LPIFALVPAVIGRAVPLSSPIEEGKSAGRGLTMVLVMFVSIGLSLVASFAWDGGWFWEFFVTEAIASVAIYFFMRAMLNRVRWKSAE